MDQITLSRPGTWILATPADGRPVLVDATVSANLRMRVMEAFVSLPKRGLEIGGVLYGRAQPDATRIQAFEEAPCEHRYGPSYSLSKADRTQLDELVEQNRTNEERPIVGFFRSFISREPLLETADEEFVRQHFPHGEFLFLMLQPLSVEHCSASIRRFRDGELVDAADAPTFAFDPAAMQSIEPQVPPPPPHEPAPAPEPDQPEPPVAPASVAARFEAPILPPPYRYQEDARPAPASGTRWWLLVAVSVIFGVLGALAFQLWQLAREPRWVPLHLDAKAADLGLMVTWDAGAAARGDRAMLTIDDGGARREVSLTPEQIRAGNLQYAPVHTDVAFRLTLYSKGFGISGDAVRIASVVERIQPSAPVAVPAKSAPPAARTSAAAPATAVHEVQPSVSEGIRSRIHSQIVIPVKVQVNENGRVGYAAAEKNRLDGLQRYLAELAEKAAREWRFTPAKSPEGAAIASSRTLTFVFTP